MNQNHSTLYKINKEYRKAVTSQLAKIGKRTRQNALKSIPKGWRFVMEDEEFCGDDKYWSRVWYQTDNLFQYSNTLAYITSRPLPQSEVQKTFADYKAEAEKLGLEVDVEHHRVLDSEDYTIVSPKCGQTTVSLIARSGELVGIGVAVCSDSDNYCKEKGRLLAIKRAISQWEKKKEKERDSVADLGADSAADSVLACPSPSYSFKVGEYVNWKEQNSYFVYGPKIIKSIPQAGVLEILYVEDCPMLLDVCRDKIWLAGTPEPV